MKNKFPVCQECGDEINPELYENCDRYFVSNGRVLCRDCFLTESKEYMETETDSFAEMIGAKVVHIE